MIRSDSREPAISLHSSRFSRLRRMRDCAAIDIDIDYILVVGHFGLATGSGGITRSNVHNESCPKPFTPR